MEVRRTLTREPFFSVCIPQYNRTSFLMEACKMLARQTFGDFEVCISDDCSTDGRESELLECLQHTRLSFTYRKLAHNGRYDRNLREAIGLARGRFCLLLGNDDSLVAPTTLEELATDLRRAGEVAVAIANYADWNTGRRFARIPRGGFIGRGPVVAARHYRAFSFLSGIVLDAARAQAHATERWDGSEMYQMFIGCRLVAEGGLLFGVERVAVWKDIRVPGERVESYASRPRVHPCPVVERPLPLVEIGRLVVDAVERYVTPCERESIADRVLRQLLCFTYVYWIVEYRRVQSWRYAVGICLAMRPKRLWRGIELSVLRKARLRLLYGTATVTGLVIPVRLFRRLYPLLYALAKSRHAAFLAGRVPWNSRAVGRLRHRVRAGDVPEPGRQR